jgi:hypothetical protein
VPCSPSRGNGRVLGLEDASDCTKDTPSNGEMRELAKRAHFASASFLQPTDPLLLAYRRTQARAMPKKSGMHDSNRYFDGFIWRVVIVEHHQPSFCCCVWDPSHLLALSAKKTVVTIYALDMARELHRTFGQNLPDVNAGAASADCLHSDEQGQRH